MIDPHHTNENDWRGGDLWPSCGIDKINDSGQVWIKWARENDNASYFEIGNFLWIEMTAYK